MSQDEASNGYKCMLVPTATVRQCESFCSGMPMHRKIATDIALSSRTISDTISLPYNALSNLVFVIFLAPAHQRLHVERASKPHCLVIKLAAAWIFRSPSAKIRIHITHLAGLYHVIHNNQSPCPAARWVLNARMPPTSGLIVHELA